MEAPMRIRSLALTLALTLASFVVACSGGGAPNGTSDAGGATEASAKSDVVSSDAPTVDVSLPASCPKLVPCGGSVLGTWEYSAACVADPFAGVAQQCPTATVTGSKGTVKGRVVFDGVKVTRTATVTFSATVVVPAECSAGQCAAVEAALKKTLDSATCKPAGGGCSCDVATSESGTQANAYTVSGTTVSIADGSTYEYCVTGDELAYVPGGGTEEKPGAYRMTKK
jgi:hypothetical protein